MQNNSVFIEFLIRPLKRKTRQWLSAPFFSPALFLGRKYPALVDLNRLIIDGPGGLLEHLPFWNNRFVWLLPLYQNEGVFSIFIRKLYYNITIVNHAIDNKKTHSILRVFYIENELADVSILTITLFAWYSDSQ